MTLSVRNVLRKICVSLAVAILAFITVFIISYLLFPVTGIEVHGERMLPQKEAKQAIPDHTSLLTLNSWTLERRLKSNPWVKDVRVYRDWNSGIVTVEVKEHHAAMKARLKSGKEFLAEDGTQLPDAGGAKLKTIDLDRGRLEEVAAAMKVLENNGVGVESIKRVDAGGVEAIAEGKILRFSDHVEPRQAQALNLLLKSQSDAHVFDLRSPERVVVGPLGAGQSG